MLTQILTYKISCSQCSRAELYNIEPNDGFYSNIQIPEGWGRIQDPPPPPEPRPRTTTRSGFSASLYFDPPIVATFREYCPTCYPMVIKAEEEQKARNEHADKYL